MDIISFGAGYTNRVPTLYKHLIKANCKNLLFAAGAFVNDEVKYGDSEMKYTMEPYMKRTQADGVTHWVASPAFFNDKDLAKMPFSRAKYLYYESFRLAADVGCKAILVGPMFFDEIEERVRLKVKQKKENGPGLTDEEEAKLKELSQAKQRDKDEVMDFYLSIVDLAKETGLKIFIPNIPEYYNGHFVRGFMTDAYRLKEFVNGLNQKAGKQIFKIQLDLGTCNLCGQNYYQVISVLGSDIGLITVTENDGLYPASLMPFTSARGGESRTDWLGIIKALRAIDYTGPLMINYYDTYNATPVSLREDVVKYGKKMADYLVWQIEMEHVIKKYDKRVLFGAGNMCRNYMKCYGQDYPPLFTCDNNKAIWGQEFEGLEIKNPEVLKELPKDVAIFLCNVYYDEIEVQLREMGIDNPIERYNDEYLPSMYADRFDAEKREIKKRD